MKYTEEELINKEQIFEKAIETPDYCIEQYKDISSTISSISQFVEAFTPENLQRVVLLVGSTGAGKSTTMNYMVYGDSAFINTKGFKLGLKKEYKEIAAIGTKNSATTLMPNMWQFQGATFIDCAGEGDSRGILVEILNALIKKRMSSNVKEAKIILFTSQAALDSEGANGVAFKNAVDKNFQFLRNPSYFKDSLAIIVTHARRSKTVLSGSIKYIDNILNTHAGVGNYKETIKHVLQNNRLVTFSKPDDGEDAEEGDPYNPPKWNPNQHAHIVNLIGNLPYTIIPEEEEGFFNVSASADVLNAVQK